MSRTLRTVAVIAGTAALVATGLGAAGVIGAKAAATISSAATITSGVASVGAQITAPTPRARGSTRLITLAPP